MTTPSAEQPPTEQEQSEAGRTAEMDPRPVPPARSASRAGGGPTCPASDIP
jgi:hypothetical protein